MRDPLESTAPFPADRAEHGGFLYTLPGVLLVVLAYALVHVAARLLASGNLGEDDPLDNLLIQTLAPGYGVRQGPLYDWALWAMQQVMGTGVHAFLLLKYGLLVAMAGFLFLIARRLTGSALWGFMAVDAMALVYQIFWRFHEGFTHRVGAMALAVITCWALLRLIDRGRHRDYALFAGLAGLGLLTEHNYAALLFALLAAAALQPAARRRVFAPAMLAALPIAALIVWPYAAWIAAEPLRVAALVDSLLPIPPAHTLAGLLRGLRDALAFPVLVLSPFIFILPAVFPGMLKTIAGRTPLRPATGAAADFSQLLLHVLLIELALLVVFDALLFQRADYAVHSLLPMFVIAIAWLIEKARESTPSPARVGAFVAIMLALTVIAFLGRAANMFVLDPVCKKCRWGIPYGELAADLRARGFRGGTLVTDDVELGGNLRRFFPDSRFVLPGRAIAPPETAHGRAGPTAIVWSSRADATDVPASLVPYLAATPPERVRVPWRHLWKPDGYRDSTWQVVIRQPAAAP